jgi:hypothetical protein
MMNQSGTNQGEWTPREIADDVSLTLVDERLLSTITGFERAGKECYASNATLAKKCRCSTRTITRRVQKLTENGRIMAENFDGRKRVLRTCGVTMTQQHRHDDEAAETQWPQNNKDDNTSTNMDDIFGQQAQIDQEDVQRPSSIEEVREYCQKNGYKVDPVEFFDYYEGNGWMTGVNTIQDWRAVLRTWHRRSEQKSKKSNSKSNKNSSPSRAPGEPGNSFDTDNFFSAALKKSFGDDFDF